MPDLTPTEARERLARYADNALARYVDNAFGRRSVDAILATTEALAALVTWPAFLAAGEKVGKVRRTHRCTGCDYPPTVNHVGYESWRLTDPEAAP